MKKIDLADKIQIIANVGVIAGIVFLAVQISQTNDLLDAEARFNRVAAAAGSMTIMAEDPDLAGYLLRANASEALAPAEALRLENFMRRTFTNIEWSYREIPVDLLPVATWRRLFAEPYRRDLWERLKSEYDPELVQFFDDRVLAP